VDRPDQGGQVTKGAVDAMSAAASEATHMAAASARSQGAVGKFFLGKAMARPTGNGVPGALTLLRDGRARTFPRQVSAGPQIDSGQWISRHAAPRRAGQRRSAKIAMAAVATSTPAMPMSHRV
jgi:hypothetical protein